MTAVGVFVWFSFCVDLGGKTLAQHVDRISDTREAKALVEGTRERVNPALEDVKTRVLGELIIAPTHSDEVMASDGGPANGAANSGRTVDASPPARAEVSGGPPRASTPLDRDLPAASEPRLPGH